MFGSLEVCFEVLDWVDVLGGKVFLLFFIFKRMINSLLVLNLLWFIVNIRYNYVLIYDIFCFFFENFGYWRIIF